MHKKLRELLHSAEGQSQRVVVVFLDVRGFTSFARIAESTDTAEFLKSAYIKILDEYFPEAVFFKPTGDGLLILLEYDRESLTEVVRNAVARSVELVESFPGFCSGDAMINFDVPSKIGIGLTRGSATALVAKRKVLDYSGRPLNLASRLMDLARPSGIVFDSSFGFSLLDEGAQKLFSKDTAYVKGVAESVPMPVFCLSGYTEIPEYNKKPLDGFVRFPEPTEIIPFKELRERGVFRHNLQRTPARTDTIEVHLQYPDIRANGTKNPGILRVASLPAKYGTMAGREWAQVDYMGEVARLASIGVKDTWQVRCTLEYSVVPEGEDAA